MYFQTTRNYFFNIIVIQYSTVLQLESFADFHLIYSLNLNDCLMKTNPASKHFQMDQSDIVLGSGQMRMIGWQSSLLYM